MSSQLAQFGDMGLVNDLAGNAYPLLQTSTPGAPNAPSQLWVNTSSTTISRWNGASWIAVTANTSLPLWLALLTTDPVLGNVVNLTDTAFTEMTTAGYSRQPVTFTTATAAYPSSCSNTAVITFGPMTATMVVPIQWVALVTVVSGTAGYILASWNLSAPIQVNTSQSIQCGIGQLVLQGQ